LRDERRAAFRGQAGSVLQKPAARDADLDQCEHDRATPRVRS
jgi:hypothetical protein